MTKLHANKTLSGIFRTHGKLLQFKKRQDFISDTDIFDLFMGLMKLIKKSAEIQVEEKYIKKINSMRRELEYLKKTK